jgi:hypothetical protein
LGFLELSQLGFYTRTSQANVARVITANYLCKFIFTAIINGIKISHKLEKESFRNLGMQWLIESTHSNQLS